MIGDRTEDIEKYHNFFMFKRPWTVNYIWRAHCGWWGEKKNLIIFFTYIDHEVAKEIKLKRKTPIIIRRNDFSPDELVSIHAAVRHQFDDDNDSISLTKGDVEFYMGKKKIAIYLDEYDVLLCVDLTHRWTPGGAMVLDWIFEELEKLEKEGKITLESRRQEKRADFITRIDGLYFVHEKEIYRAEITIRLKDASKIDEDVITTLTQAFLKEKISKIEHAYNRITEMLGDTIRNLRESGQILIIQLASQKYPLYVYKGIPYVIVPFRYFPKKVIYNDKIYDLPEEVVRPFAFDGFLGFRVQTDAGDLFLDFVRIFSDDLLPISKTMPHYNGEAMCLGNIPIRYKYSGIPSYKEFFYETVKPVIDALDTVNLSSAYESDETDVYKEFAKKMEEKSSATAESVWKIEEEDER